MRTGITKQYNNYGIQGCVERRCTQKTHTYTSVYSTAQIGLVDATEPWMTLCEVHGTICEYETLTLAKDFMRDPREWCPDCYAAWLEKENGNA